jgi:7-cyano-7-deazaguanine synthase
MIATVLLSGGMDSSVLLHHVVKQRNFKTVHALTVHYGQKHSREIESAKWQASKLPEVTEHRVVDLSVIGSLLGDSSALINTGMEIPTLESLDESEREQPPTYVPNRNMMMLAVAAAYAESHDCTHLFYGAQAQDQYGYWDCTPDFLVKMNAVLGLNRRKKVQIEAPFIGMRKSEEITLGLELGVDFGQTWTCYAGGEKACGRCPSCSERMTAFQEVGIEDPLAYE